ncbi:MAG: PQQ-binding-like beta-propeller repeat protein, partial [Phycisphaerae bacterium]
LVHVGCGDGKLTAALGASDSFLVHGLDADAANVEKAREHIRSLGLYGKVSVELWKPGRLPYAGNLVSLLVSQGPSGAPVAEMMRVLVPGGVACVKRGGGWTKTVKPRPKEIDDWTHYLHDATGNAVSTDRLAGVPRYVQWVADPRFTRHHDAFATVGAMVSANGRLYYIVDEAPASLTHLPARWRLVARDAFSGVVLWKRPIAKWVNDRQPFRQGPFDVPRRLVAVGDRVFVTLGYEAPISCLDGATGETIRTYAATAGAEEIVIRDGVLLVTVGRPGTRRLQVPDPQSQASAAKRRGKAVTGTKGEKTKGRGRGNAIGGLTPATTAHTILAIDAETGTTLWKLTGDDVAGLYVQTLAAIDGRVVYKTAGELHCVDFKTGRRLWRAASGAKGLTTLVAHDDVVLVADAGVITAFGLADGRQLWTGPCQGTFHVSPDVFVIDGLVWAGTGKPDRKLPLLAVGRDLHTGQEKRRIGVTTGLWSSVAHHRCHKCKATVRYIMTAQRGIELIDLHGEGHYQSNWIRATCQYGHMPANGLVYFPPHACGCFVKGKVNGFFAVAETREETVPLAPVCEKGPAFGPIRNLPAGKAGPQSALRLRSGQVIRNRADWPTFRHDGRRTGVTPSAVPAGGLKVAWRADVGGKLSTLTAADGKLYVASVDRHTVHAIDASSGKGAWSFTAGGRVDSPPTIHEDLALLGAADGWVYCLRADDGALAWRYRVAPDERRIVSRGQVESAWPSHGAVLIHEDLAYVSAGRSSYLDGGIRICALDPKTGKVVHQARVVGEHLKSPEVSYEEHVRQATIGDLLVTDGTDVYMRMMRFNTKLERQPKANRHLFAISGLLDDSWFYRTLWMYDDDRRMPGITAFEGPKSYYVNHAYNPETAKKEWLNFITPSGQLLAIADGQAYGIRAIYDSKGSLGQTQGCRIYRMDGTDRKWMHRVGVQFRAMVLAGETLFLAGWPDVADQTDPLAASDGRKGGLLWAVSSADGGKACEYKLDSPPVFDGLIAAGGRLYMAHRNGTVTCWGAKQAP